MHEFLELTDNAAENGLPETEIESSHLWATHIQLVSAFGRLDLTQPFQSDIDLKKMIVYFAFINKQTSTEGTTGEAIQFLSERLQLIGSKA